MKPCGFGNPSCTVRGTLPAGPRSVTYSRQPFDRYGISSASVLRAWWTSQSMTGPEYMIDAPFGGEDGVQGGHGARPAPRLELLQSFDLIGANLVGHGVVQDLDRRVNRCVRIRRDLSCRLPDALHPRRVTLLLGGNQLGVRKRVAERLVEGRREVEEAIRVSDRLARWDEARAVGEVGLVVVALDDFDQTPRALGMLGHLGVGDRPASERAGAAWRLSLRGWQRNAADLLGRRRPVAILLDS